MLRTKLRQFANIGAIIDVVAVYRSIYKIIVSRYKLLPECSFSCLCLHCQPNPNYILVGFITMPNYQSMQLLEMSEILLGRFDDAQPHWEK